MITTKKYYIYYPVKIFLLKRNIINLIEQAYELCIIDFNNNQHNFGCLELLGKTSIELNRPVQSDLNAVQLAMIRKIHYSWFNELKDYFLTKEFSNIINTIHNLRTKSKVYPDKDYVWLYLKNPLDKCIFIVIANEPYKDGSQIAPLTSNYTKTDAKLFWENIAKYNIDISNLLILNISLTSDNSPVKESHLKIWEPFTSKIFQILSEQKQRIFLFLDNNKLYLTENINSKENYIFFINQWEESENILTSISQILSL